MVFQGGLVPSLPRQKHKESPWINDELLYHIEQQSTAQFASKAHLYLDRRFLPADPKAEGVSLHWWQLMQHHGANTRILDWSGSSYVVAYFAAAASPDDDGAVWMVDQGAHLNRMADMYPDQFPSKNVRRVKLQVDPRGPADQNLSASLFFFPVTVPNERMSAQRVWFSCGSEIEADHGEAIAKAFLHANAPGRWSLKVIISKEAKTEILRDLWLMNITAETLFPGLDGLGQSLAKVPTLLAPDGANRLCFEDGLLAAWRPASPK